MLLIAAFLYCFWKLAYIFYTGGAAGLARASKELWSFMVTAMAYSILGTLVFLYDQVTPGALPRSFETLLIMLELGSAGLPVVVPTLHLAWMYRQAKPEPVSPGRDPS